MPGSDARVAASVLEAHPHATILVDRERRVVYANAAARALLGARAGADLARSLGCVEAAFGPCRMTSTCARCAVGQTIAAALDGRPARGRAFLIRGEEHDPANDLHVLVSASPFERGGAPHAILVLQDVNALLADPDVLRVCGGCGRVQDDDGGEWYPLQRYLEDRLGLEGGSLLCPACSAGARRR